MIKRGLRTRLDSWTCVFRWSRHCESLPIVSPESIARRMRGCLCSHMCSPGLKQESGYGGYAKFHNCGYIGSSRPKPYTLGAWPAIPLKWKATAIFDCPSFPCPPPLRFKVQGLGFRVQGFGYFGVWGLGFIAGGLDSQWVLHVMATSGSLVPFCPCSCWVPLLINTKIAENKNPYHLGATVLGSIRETP